jgi:hypothetical protein
MLPSYLAKICNPYNAIDLTPKGDLAGYPYTVEPPNAIGW